MVVIVVFDYVHPNFNERMKIFLLSACKTNPVLSAEAGKCTEFLSTSISLMNTVKEAMKFSGGSREVSGSRPPLRFQGTS